MRRIARGLGILVVVVGLALLAVRCNLGEANRLEDRTGPPLLPGLGDRDRR